MKELEDLKIYSGRSSAPTKLREENQETAKQLNRSNFKLDDKEQRSRNHCLLIHGCAKTTDDIAMEVMSIQLGLLHVTRSDISRSRRVGSKANERRNIRSNASTPHRPTPIIVRFANWNIRDKIFKNIKTKG